MLWNPIEHRVFSEMSKTWAGCPLRTFDVMLTYLNDTKTQTGLRVQAHLVTQTYETGVKVPDAERWKGWLSTITRCVRNGTTPFLRVCSLKLPRLNGKLYFYRPQTRAHWLTYDAENHLMTVSGVTNASFTHDGSLS